MRVKILTAQKLKIFTPLSIFSLIIFFVSLHDGIISYITPIILNDRYNDSLIVGSIISISSFFGIFFNFLIAKFFPKKDYRFFISRMIFFAFITPLSYLLLPRKLIPFALIMITWSIYYEFRNYAKYNFVEEFLPPQKNTDAWSVMSVFQSLAYSLGPILAFLLMSKSVNSALIGSMIIVIMSGITYIAFEKNHPKRKKYQSEPQIRSLFKGLKIINIIAKRIWPLVLFTAALTLLDVSFWTVGVLYSEKLRMQTEVGGLFLTMYTLPFISISPIVSKIHEPLGKKRTAFISAILAGLGLIIFSLLKNVYLILVMVLITAIFSNIAFILIYATFEDYITRLDGEGNNLVSIGQISQNFAYAVGPIFLGYISRNENFELSFRVTGLILIAFSLLAIVSVPRKIKMPRKQIAAELNKDTTNGK